MQRSLSAVAPQAREDAPEELDRSVVWVGHCSREMCSSATQLTSRSVALKSALLYKTPVALGAQLPVRLDPDVDQRLADAARSAGTTKSAIIRMLAKSFVDQCVGDDGSVKLPPNWAELLGRADGRSKLASGIESKTPSTPQLASSSPGRHGMAAGDPKGSKRDQYDAETKRLRAEDERKRHEVMSALNVQAVKLEDQAIGCAEVLLAEACKVAGVPVPVKLRQRDPGTEASANPESTSPAPQPRARARKAARKKPAQ